MATRVVLAVLLVCLSSACDMHKPLQAEGDSPPTASVVVSLSYTSRHRRVSWLEMGDLGGHLRRLTQPLAGSRIFSPLWSPDGRHVAFIRRTERDSGVYVIGVDGGAPTRIAKLRPFGNLNVPLNWTADGSSVVTDRFSGVECQTKKPFRLRFTIARTPGRSRDIDALPRPRRGVYLQDVSSSPDGRRFSVIVIDHGPNTCDGHAGDFETLLYTIRVDGADRKLLARAAAITSSDWSGDGQWLAYLALGSAGCHVDAVAANGSQKRRLLRDVDCDGQVRWQPHASAIAFADHDRLEVVDVASGRARTLLRSSVSFPARHSFSSDGHWLAVIKDQGADKTILVRIALVPLAGGAPVTYDVRRDSPPLSADDGDLIFR